MLQGTHQPGPTPTQLSVLRAPTHGVDGMECPSHWPELHSLRAQGARDEGGEPGAPLGPQGAVGLRRRWRRRAGAALPGRARPQPGRLGGRGGGGGGRALQGGRGGGRRAGAVPAVRYERLLQPPAEAGAHHPAQQESQQSGAPAARYRLHPGSAAGAGDAPGSTEAAAAARAAAPPGRDLPGRATADPAHRAQHRPGRRGEQAGRQHSLPLSRASQVSARFPSRVAGHRRHPVPGAFRCQAPWCSSPSPHPRPSISESRFPRRRTPPPLSATQLVSEPVLRSSENWGTDQLVSPPPPVIGRSPRRREGTLVGLGSDVPPPPAPRR